MQQSKNLLLTNLPNDLINYDLVSMGDAMTQGDCPVYLGDTVVEQGIVGTPAYQG
jgi:hypothetical protein